MRSSAKSNATQRPLANPLTGEVGLVTGAGRGIGRALALRLAREGVALALVARTETELRAVAGEIAASGGQALAAVGDVSDDNFLRTALARVREALGAITVLVNNAGWGPPRTPLARTDAADIEQMLRTNLRAPIFLARALLPDMQVRRRGWILNVCSAYALDPHPGEAVYAATKAGLLSFSRALARECAAAGIRVAALCPGYVDTALIPHRRGLDRSRLLRPDEVADAAMGFFLGTATSEAIEVLPRTVEEGNAR